MGSLKRTAGARCAEAERARFQRIDNVDMVDTTNDDLLDVRS